MISLLWLDVLLSYLISFSLLPTVPFHSVIAINCKSTAHPEDLWCIPSTWRSPVFKCLSFSLQSFRPTGLFTPFLPYGLEKKDPTKMDEVSHSRKRQKKAYYNFRDIIVTGLSSYLSFVIQVQRPASLLYVVLWVYVCFCL